MRREAPGILWQLIQAAPRVFERDVELPESVQEAPADVMDENDVARPFIEPCLEQADTVTAVPEIATAVQKWLGGLVVGFNGHNGDPRLE